MCCSNCFFISCDVFLIYCVAFVELSIYIDKADKYKAFFLSRLNSCFPLLFFCIPYQISNWTLSCLPSPPSSFLPFSTHLPFHDNWTFIDRVTVSALNPRGIFHHPPGFFLLHTWIISCPLHPVFPPSLLMLHFCHLLSPHLPVHHLFPSISALFSLSLPPFLPVLDTVSGTQIMSDIY